jgi:hypothetical protein
MEHVMRAALVLLIIGLGLAACGGSDKTVVVVPQGATVICPGGAPAVLSNGAYRC